jgi:hypothetical protein
VFNVLFAFYPFSLGRRWLGLPLLYLLGFSLVSFLLRPTFVPKLVMHIFKFGNFKTSSLVLDHAGCTIARDHGLQEGSDCNFSDVIIHSRLGSTYYVEKDGTSVCFTVPAKEVLSWSIADKQSPEDGPKGCNPTK